MRNAFAEEITQLATLDKRIVLLSGDIGNKLFDNFKKTDANRFYNCGVAEANMMGVAAGMALSGLRPVVYTITPFTTTRCFEQIRVDVCYHQAPVIIVGTGSGLAYAELGPTHHSLEDLAILRTLPGMCVLAPCDAMELRAALRASLQQDQPVYIRIGKKGEPTIHKELPNFSIGKALIMRQGIDVAILSTGTMMTETLKAADLLKQQNISATVASFHSIKPLDTEFLRQVTSHIKLLVTVEEHGLIGGLGSAIAQWCAISNCRVAQLNFATPDEFMHEIGSQAYALTKYGLVAENIASGVLTRLHGLQ